MSTSSRQTRQRYIGLAVGRGERGVDVVEALQIREAGVDLDDDAFCALHNLGRGADGGAGHDVAVLSDGCGLDDGPVERLGGVATGLGEAVVAVGEVLGKHWRVSESTRRAGQRTDWRGACLQS